MDVRSESQTGSPINPPSIAPDQFQRMLRYAAIDFHKFWVELQSTPAFLGTLNQASLGELEAILHWLRTAPSWQTKIKNPRLVPELARPESRKRFTSFIQEIRCVRALRQELLQHLSSVPEDSRELATGFVLAAEASELARAHEMSECDETSSGPRLKQAQERFKEISELRVFFNEVAHLTGAPVPANTREARVALEALEALTQMPERIRVWRQPSVLDPEKRVRLQAWHDRAVPLRALRQRLSESVLVDEPIGVPTLTRILEEIEAGGIFSMFKSSYKDAVEAYQGLRCTPNASEGKKKKVRKESQYEMVERLREWIKYLEMVENFDEKFDARILFGDLFQGPDTDFAAALEANAWAAQIRSKMAGDDDSARWMEMVLTLPEGKLIKLCEKVAAIGPHGLRQKLQGLDAPQDASWQALEQDRHENYRAISKIRQVSRKIGLRSGLAFSTLASVSQLLEEILFLIERIEAGELIKQTLKGEFAGENTSIQPIEDALAYVSFIQTAPIREELRGVFLSGTGVLRLADARMTASRPMPSLKTVQEHFQRIQNVSPRLKLQETPLSRVTETLQGML